MPHEKWHIALLNGLSISRGSQTFHRFRTQKTGELLAYLAMNSGRAISREELADIEGFDETVAEELIRRAEAFLVRRDEQLTEQRIALGVSDDVASFEFFTPQMLVTLGEKGVNTLDDLADLAGDELVEFLGAEIIDEATANDIIMAARAHWFEGEDAPAAPAEGDAAEEASNG